MKDKNKEFISIRVESQTKKELTKKANKEHRTLSSYLRLMFMEVIGK